MRLFYWVEAGIANGKDEMGREGKRGERTGCEIFKKRPPFKEGLGGW